MSKEVRKRIADLKLSVGTGHLVEQLCIVMAVVTLAAGAICAIAFGKMPARAYPGDVRMEVSAALVITYLVSGVLGAIVWFVLSKIGTALRWLEAIGTASLFGSVAAISDAPAAAAEAPVGGTSHQGLAQTTVESEDDDGGGLDPRTVAAMIVAVIILIISATRFLGSIKASW